MSDKPSLSSVPAMAGRTDPATAGASKLFRSVLTSRVISMLIVFLLLAIYFQITSDGVFLSSRNVTLLLRQAAIVAVVAAGVSILMVMGEIDLSIGSAAFLCSAIAAILQVWYGVPTVAVVFVTLVVGAALGAWHAIWVIWVGVPSFVVTLAGLLAFRGIGYQLSGAQTIAPMQMSFVFLSEGFIPPVASYVVLAAALAIGLVYIVRRHRQRANTSGADTLRLVASVAGFAAAVAFLAYAFGGYLGMPMALVWVALIGVILWVLMARSKFGRNAYMIGSNREAAVLSGINLSRELFLGFLVMGFLYGIAGILLTARLGSSTPSTGTFMELDAIAGAVIGGTSLRGGVGTTAGAMVGAVLLTTIDNGMSILNVSSFLQLVVKGIVLLLALAFDAYVIRHRTYTV